MNIFILSEDPVEAARQHCDKHCVKMILENAQMLSTAHWCSWQAKLEINNKKLKETKFMLRQVVPSHLQPQYSMTHVNHPCTVWVRETEENYNWTCIHAKELCAEYTRRYKKVHKSESVIDWLVENKPCYFPKNSCLTEFAQAMPDIYKVKGNAVQAYRNYYIGEKAKFAKWKYSQTPEWWPKHLAD